MRVPLSKIIALAAAIALSVLGLSACGSEGTPEESPQTVVDDPSESDDTEAERPSAEAGGPLTVDNFAERVTRAQLNAGTVHMTQQVEMDGVTATTEGDVVFGNGTDVVAMHLIMTTPVGSQEMLIVDGNSFMRMEGVTDNKWVHYADLGKTPDGVDDSAESFDPLAQINAMMDSLVDFTVEENAEVIDGVNTAKVTIFIDTASFFDDIADEWPDSSTIEETMTQVMFVGDDGLVRRQVIEIGGTQTITEFTRWGEPVNIVAPSEDEITDFASLTT